MIVYIVLSPDDKYTDEVHEKIVHVFVEKDAADAFAAAFDDLRVGMFDTDAPLPEGYKPGLKWWQSSMSNSAGIASYNGAYGPAVWAATEAEAVTKLAPLLAAKEKERIDNEIRHTKQRLQELERMRGAK